MNDIQLSQHFTVAELCNLKKYPKNIPTIQQITSMTYGCRHLLSAHGDSPPVHTFLPPGQKYEPDSGQGLTPWGWLARNLRHKKTSPEWLYLILG